MKSVDWAFRAGAEGGLTPEERYVLVAIASKAESLHRSARVSKRALAAMTGLGSYVVVNACSGLKSRGLIVEEPGVGPNDASEFRLQVGER